MPKRGPIWASMARDHDVYLAGMRRESERRVRRLTIIGDSLNEAADDYAYLYPDELQPAQLILIKWMFDRRENPDDAKSPPPLYGMIDGYERGEGQPKRETVAGVRSQRTRRAAAAADFLCGLAERNRRYDAH